MGRPVACVGALLWSALAIGAGGDETRECSRDTDGPALLQMARSRSYVAKGVDGSTGRVIGGGVKADSLLDGETDEEVGNQTSSQTAPPANEVCPGPSCGAPGCPGFVECPTDFPLPYQGEYPQEYPYNGPLHFPPGFHWGVGTAAYQIEGAYNEGGRGASIWDTFSGANTVGMPGSLCEEAPCPVSSSIQVKGATGNIANDHYHKYKQDVAMMKSMGLKNYRFSVAWPRLVPTGIKSDGVNQKGVDFYHNLIDELIASGIEPHLTMYHWDLPQGLLDFKWNETIPTCNNTYKQGWFECTEGTDGKPVPVGIEALAVREFVNYAKLLYSEYGSKVRYWYTFNEAATFTIGGSGGRGKAPNVQPWFDPDIWPYVAGHNVIIASALAVKEFRALQANGSLSSEHEIAIVNNQDWREPQTNSPSDIAASQYSLEGQLGWFCDPIYGVDGVHDYPLSMTMTLPYMPAFTDDEKDLLKANRPDHFGLNHYGTGFIKYNCTGSGEASSSCTNEDGIPQAVSTWLYQSAWGFRKLLNWVSKRYGQDLPIYWTEGGWSENTISPLQAKFDSGRLMYYYTYVKELWNAIFVDRVNVKGFMAWSLMDNYEWERGYAERFGCLFTDFNFGDDPDAPDATTPIYNASAGKVSGVCGIDCTSSVVGKPASDPEVAYNQTRHAKNSILWLQWVWATNALVDSSRFLAASIGGDVCYGEGERDGVKCALNSSVPGPPPAEAWGR